MWHCLLRSNYWLKLLWNERDKILIDSDLCLMCWCCRVKEQSVVNVCWCCCSCSLSFIRDGLIDPCQLMLIEQTVHQLTDEWILISGCCGRDIGDCCQAREVSCYVETTLFIYCTSTKPAANFEVLRESRRARSEAPHDGTDRRSFAASTRSPLQGLGLAWSFFAKNGNKGSDKHTTTTSKGEGLS